MSTATQMIKEKWRILLIVICTVLVYANTLKHGFVLDDIAVINGNKIVQKGVSGIPEILKTFYWQGFWDSNAGLYRPLSLVSFAVEYQLSANNPFIHHFFNVLYYVLCCCLLYKLLVKWFPKMDTGILLLITLLFIVHPIHTEVVANIKSRDEIFALLFFLLSALALKPGSLKSMIISSLYFFLALLSKEGAIMLLPILVLQYYFSQKTSVAALAKTFAPFMVITVLWLIIHQYVIKHGPPVITYTYNDNSLLSAASVAEQKATAFGILARYFVKLIYPYGMSYDYSFNQIPIVGFASGIALAGIFLFGFLIYSFVKFYKKDPFIALAIALILLPLLITSNLFFTIGATAADRFLFVSSIGSTMLMGYLPFKLWDPNVKNGTLQYGIFFVVIVFGVMSVNRNKAWKDNYSLFENDVKTSVNSARAHYNYGTALMNLKKPTADNIAGAREEFQTCLQIDPQYADASVNLGVLLMKQKEYPAALSCYRKALAKQPESSTLYGNFGDVFFRNNQFDSAVIYLEKAHALGNKNIESYNIEGTSLFKLQKYPEACKAFEEGILVDSTLSNLYLNYGNSLAMSNRDKEAIRALERSYQLDSSSPQALYFIAITYNKLGDTLNANKYYREFKALNP